MNASQNLVVRFARAPEPGPLSADVFAYEYKSMPSLRPGEVLVRALYLSIDAGSRAQLDDRSDYVLKAMIGKVLGSSGAVVQVVESLDPNWQVGDLLATTYARWQHYQVLTPTADPLLLKIDPTLGPLHLYLGALGMVGFTAYVGTCLIGKPKPGETMLVSAAAGATGSLAGQMGKILGARVVGIAGGAEKCAWVTEKLGFDACIDYKAGSLDAALREACPDGVDVYYENVGGAIQQAAFAQMNDFGRVVMCGQVGQYSGEGAQPGPNLMSVILKRLTVQGFMAMDYIDQHSAFLLEAGRWVQKGTLTHEATVTSGLTNIHEAINSLVSGANIGKQVCAIT